MRARFLLLILFFYAFLFSCESRGWTEDIQNRVNVYNRNARELANYTLESGSTVIFVTEYAEQDGLKKTLARHFQEETLNFERHIFTENNEIVYTQNIGVAPQLRDFKAHEFLMFNEQTFWKSKGVGLKLNQHVPTDDIVVKEAALELLHGAQVTERELSATDYDKIYKYLDELVSSKPKK
ncbi:hypothetical protein GTQ34_13295 [Muricauda sp. JGD-17]|uniref:Uncharacterized protein n=1 Tax=Flagellimonas ochracea TaxID=2696472 RepID=A0A964TDH0_9FLAO|nr:hypothetical protein [Allomuricauda ochracea]NAY92892.1 hypothetical protein [Allomuricauda ochracea]